MNKVLHDLQQGTRPNSYQSRQYCGSSLTPCNIYQMAAVHMGQEIYR